MVRAGLLATDRPPTRPYRQAGNVLGIDQGNDLVVLPRNASFADRFADHAFTGRSCSENTGVPSEAAIASCPKTDQSGAARVSESTFDSIARGLPSVGQAKGPVTAVLPHNVENNRPDDPVIT